MRILVTGGTGFIGTALLRALVADGHDVMALTRRPAGMVGPRAVAGVRYVGWDTRGDGSWHGHVDGVDAVVNLAGEPIAEGRWTTKKKARIRQSRLDATQALTTAIQQVTRKPAVFISGSAIGFYGAHGTETVTESDGPGRDFLAQVCRDWEAAAMQAASSGVRVVLLRTGVVLGPGGALAKLLPLARLGLGGPIGNGRQGFSWIHLADAIGLIRWALTTPAVSGPLNATAPHPVSQGEFARTLGRVLHRPAFLPVPGPALRLGLGELADTLLTGAYVQPQKALDLGYRFQYPDLTAALNALLDSR